jgi:hypothetical protein
MYKAQLNLIGMTEQPRRNNMTPIFKVYEAFLSKMLEDEWLNWTQEEVEKDWRMLLDAAIPNFKFPRVRLEIDDNDCFVDDVSNEEIQILATFMKCEWLNREILTWENIKPLYVERDFSQANLIDKLQKLVVRVEYKARKLERIYYRSIKNKPFDYTRLAGE